MMACCVTLGHILVHTAIAHAAFMFGNPETAMTLMYLKTVLAVADA